MAEGTIAAISTALGEGGIAIIRISGTDAVSVAQKVLKRQELEDAGRMYLTSLVDGEGNVIDRVLAVRFARPRSYTGEDIVEIHTHGGIMAARTCLGLVLENGARIAEPGEFTRRAYINGRIDLAQVEGVLDVIHAKSLEALHAAARTLTGELSREIQKVHDDILTLQGNLEIQIDFPEGETLSGFDPTAGLEAIITELEGLVSRCSAGMILRDGVRVVIAGSPNAGKSSLLNALLRKNRAIVTDIPGTTRDIIEESIIIDGIPVRLADTAGLRESDDMIEAEGVRLALEAVNGSDICLYVVDSSREITGEEHGYIGSLEGKNAIIVFSKSDLPAVIHDVKSNARKVHVSAKEYTGIDELRAAIRDMASGGAVLNSGLNVSARQLDDMRASLEAMNEALASVSLGEDITAGMLNTARILLLRVLGIDASLYGSQASDEVLDSMFNRFCVGK